MEKRNEEYIRERVLTQEYVVVLNSKIDCPVCEYYIPDVLEPVFSDEKYNHIEFYELEDELLFPIDVRPRLFFFKKGKPECWSTGALPQYEVYNLLERYYGKSI
jgi:hypothetical protein